MTARRLNPFLVCHPGLAGRRPLLATDEAGGCARSISRAMRSACAACCAGAMGRSRWRRRPAPEAVTGPIRRYFAGDVRRPARNSLAHRRHGLPAGGLAGPDHDPAGPDAELRRLRREDRRADGGARGGPGQRRQPGRARRPLPPGHRRRRLPDRLRRRPGTQALAVATRRRALRGQGGGVGEGPGAAGASNGSILTQ